MAAQQAPKQAPPSDADVDATAPESAAGNGAGMPPDDAASGTPPGGNRGSMGGKGGAVARLRGRARATVLGRPVVSGAVAVALTISLAAAAAAGFGVGAPAPGEIEMIDLAPATVFHPLPTMVTDLRPGRHRPHYVKLDVVLEVGADLVPRLTEREPAILDAIKAVLRDYERSDLVGTAGARRLRSDLIVVIDQDLQPARVRGLLFKQFVLD